MSHPVWASDEQLLAACEICFTRRGGPGGQHRNKVSTAVVLTHQPSGIIAEANERRSQSENRRVAVSRLRLLLATHVRGELANTAPSALWRARVREGRIQVASEHADFPLLLAEALDLLIACGGDLTAASLRLLCTASQLAKFIKRHPPAWSQVCLAREAAGLPRLK